MVAALVKASNGFKLFPGTATKADMKGDRGFTWWDVEITGTNDYAGHTYKLYFKNENVMSWFDGKPDASAPDIITAVDPKTGDTLFGQGLGAYPMNAGVVMIGIPNPMWRTPKGLDVCGPRHFGFDVDHTQVEEVVKARPKM